ncbi:MAG: hypothetical protein PWP52_907 [Bacteroidales bacterium]|jgi:hypothetical protein|nr:hypothetical protein [Bacteroidales bacterium]
MNGKLKIVNVFLFITFLITGLSGILHEILIPMGIYSYIHIPAAYLFFILACTHIWLNRKWIIQALKRK